MAKKVEEIQTTDPRLAQFMASDFLKKVKKAHGAHIIDQASNGLTVQGRIPTGVFGLDYGLAGGWAAGRINTVFGHESTGKSLLATLAVAEVQNRCSNCYAPADHAAGVCTGCGDYRTFIPAYIDTEGTFDKAWAQKLGVDTERLMLSQPEYAEQSLDIMDALLRSGEVDFLVLDSLAFLVPAKEIEESVAKDLMGRQAAVIGRGTRKAVAALNELANAEGRRPTILFTNQIRYKLGVMFGNPETVPGGKGPRFAASVEVKLLKGKPKMDSVTGFPLYTEVGFRVEKNKTGPAKYEGDFRLFQSDTEFKGKGSIMDEHTMIKQAERVGFVEREGTGWRCKGTVFPKRDALLERLFTDVQFAVEFRDSLMDILLAGV